MFDFPNSSTILPPTQGPGLVGRATMLCALTEKVPFWSPLTGIYGDTGVLVGINHQL